jgi:hypothetical protein
VAGIVSFIDAVCHFQSHAFIDRDDLVDFLPDAFHAYRQCAWPDHDRFVTHGHVFQLGYNRRTTLKKYARKIQRRLRAPFSLLFWRNTHAVLKLSPFFAGSS